MANDINFVVLIGRIVRDVEIKTTNNGGQIAKFSLASSRSEKRGDRYEDVVGYYDCILFGKRSEALIKYAGKGSKICVEGKLKWSSWEGSDGKKQSNTEIEVQDFQFLDSKKSEGGPRGTFDSGALGDEAIPF